MFSWFRRPRHETRSSGAGYTAQIMAARAAYFAGMSGLAEVTATVQGCVSLWENAFALADVSGTDLLDRRTMALIARALALRGEAVFLIGDGGLLAASDWDVATADGIPRAYRLSVNETGGGRSRMALAGEVLHVRIGSDPVTPWAGSAPLRRAGLTAELLHVVETALRDVYRDAPIGSLIAHLPEGSADDMATMRDQFRGRRGSTLIVEGVAQSTAAGMNPMLGKVPDQLTPDLSRAMTRETLAAARDGISMAFGCLPGLANPATTGPMVREAQRHLASWTLQPLAELLAEEATAKLGAAVTIDVGRPMQAFDAGGRARALATTIAALAQAKESGLSPTAVDAALSSVNWGANDNAA